MIRMAWAIGNVMWRMEIWRTEMDYNQARGWSAHDAYTLSQDSSSPINF